MFILCKRNQDDNLGGKDAQEHRHRINSGVALRCLVILIVGHNCRQRRSVCGGTCQQAANLPETHFEGIPCQQACQHSRNKGYGSTVKQPCGTIGAEQTAKILTCTKADAYENRYKIGLFKVCAAVSDDVGSLLNLLFTAEDDLDVGNIFSRNVDCQKVSLLNFRVLCNGDVYALPDKA